MFKLILFTISICLFHANAFAKEMICIQPNNPKVSILKIQYADNSPAILSLKNPDADAYRTLDLNIELVSQTEDYESFSAKPKLNQTIDWDNEPNCFKQIGTQWYFIFDYRNQAFEVLLLPYFERKNISCILPRHKPQNKILNCQIFN